MSNSLTHSSSRPDHRAARRALLYPAGLAGSGPWLVTRVLALCRAAVPALAVTFLFTGCTTLLDDDFEDYQVGTSVGGNIPGSPTGDSIIAQGPGNLYTVRTTTPLSGAQSLELNEALPIEEPFRLFFVPVPAEDDGRNVYVSWRGRLENPTDATLMHVTIVQPDEEAFFQPEVLRFEVRRHQLEMSGGTNIEAGGRPAMPVWEGDFRIPHSVLVRLSPDSGTFGVEIVGGGVDPQSNDRTGTISLDEFTPDNLALSVQFIGTSATDVRYRVDDAYFGQLIF